MISPNRKADPVFIAPFKHTPQQRAIIFVMVEHQSTPSRIMSFRVLFYMLQLWDGQRQRWEREQIPESQWSFRPILPLVFYTGSGHWERPLELKELMDLPETLARFVPDFDLLFLNLKAIPSQNLLTESTAFGHLLQVMQEEDAPLEEFQSRLTEAVSRVEALTQGDSDEWTRVLYYFLLLIYHRRQPDE